MRLNLQYLLFINVVALFLYITSVRSSSGESKEKKSKSAASPETAGIPPNPTEGGTPENPTEGGDPENPEGEGGESGGIFQELPIFNEDDTGKSDPSNGLSPFGISLIIIVCSTVLLVFIALIIVLLKSRSSPEDQDK